MLSNIILGNISSTMPMSLENLFRIRPEGLVSKNRIVADIMLLNIKLCNFIELRIHTHRNNNDLKYDSVVRKLPK